jgi:hypothetical protein
MIKILFPAGGYGTYLARCLYSYTDLNNGITNKLLDFDSLGSSHSFRSNYDAKTKIWQGHLTSLDWEVNNGDLIIIVLPNKEHYLDYYNNQFDKHYNQQIITYISSQLSVENITNDLKIGWGYCGPFNLDVPRWIMREFFSFWIAKCFDNGYTLDGYNTTPSQHTIDTQDIILNFVPTFNILCEKLKLTTTVDHAIIIQNHKNFLEVQQHHNIQLKCEQWVNSIIEGNEMISPCKTIFDEAYIQHILRTRGYEVRCHELTEFPKSSLLMNSKFIYENCNNNNPRRSKY